MSAAIVALARGDYLERIRRPAFLVTLAFMIYAAYVFLPARGSGYLTLDLKWHRPLYNSAGIGALLTLLSGTFIGLAGFYLVRGAIERDRVTGVGSVLAATKLGRIPYLFSKLASGFAVLASMMAVLWLAGAVLQIVLGEDRAFDAGAWITPLLVFSLPNMLVIAAVAVLFDVVPGLRGGFGNVVYFFLWCGAIPWAAAIGRKAGILDDPFGSNAIISSILKSARAEYPQTRFGDGDVSMGFHILGHGQRAYPDLIHWDGVSLTWEILAARLAWVIVGLVIVVASAPWFDRFAEAPAAKGTKRRLGSRLRDPMPASGGEAAALALPAAPQPAARVVHIQDLGRPWPGSSIGPLLAAEWKLIVRAQPLPWKLASVALVIVGCFVPLQGARAVVVLIAWIWPILAWSELGMRERRFGTEPLLFSVPSPVLRPLLAGWLAGFSLALVLVAPVALRLLVTGSVGGALSLVVGAAFIPAMALACGAWTGGRKLFEVLYLLVWYMGPLNHVPFLDFTGNTPGAATIGFGVASVGLFSAAVLARSKALAV